ncbi:MAG TPA: TIGR04282 family arsenosugar biosynthesis glycosyltransferase [Burkholderiales bacterium]
MSPLATRDAVIVFAKAPMPGAVKTRLIPVLGPEGAAALHGRLVERTVATASVAARDTVELHVAPEDDFLRCCAARYNAALVPQCGLDLGDRMHHAFERALLRGRCSAVVLIGSDCPALTALHIRCAFEALHDGYDAVLGPAEDGGYVLLGLTRTDRRMFEGIAWGTSEVLDQTRARLRGLGWRWRELETLWDVDTPADWARLKQSQLMGPVARLCGTGGLSA